MSFPCHILGGFPHCIRENSHPTRLKAVHGVFWERKSLSQIFFPPKKRDPK